MRYLICLINMHLALRELSSCYTMTPLSSFSSIISNFSNNLLNERDCYVVEKTGERRARNGKTHSVSINMTFMVMIDPWTHAVFPINKLFPLGMAFAVEFSTGTPHASYALIPW